MIKINSTVSKSAFTREHKSLEIFMDSASLSPSKSIFHSKAFSKLSFFLRWFQVQPSDANRPRFVAVTSLEDVQAVRCAEFHPNGSVYAIGSNSKTFRICEYPSLSEIR
jgi:WD40 repeat protein